MMMVAGSVQQVLHGSTALVLFPTRQYGPSFGTKLQAPRKSVAHCVSVCVDGWVRVCVDGWVRVCARHVSGVYRRGEDVSVALERGVGVRWQRQRVHGRGRVCVVTT